MSHSMREQSLQRIQGISYPHLVSLVLYCTVLFCAILTILWEHQGPPLRSDRTDRHADERCCRYATSACLHCCCCCCYSHCSRRLLICWICCRFSASLLQSLPLLEKGGRSRGWERSTVASRTSVLLCPKNMHKRNRMEWSDREFQE